jgi:hypothetical protein
MLSNGEIVFVITRRLFEGDLRRHFVGKIENVSGAIIRTRGYIFIFDESSKEFVRRKGQRVRIFSLIDAGIVVNVLPSDINISEMHYAIDNDNHRIITDGKSYSMNVSEFTFSR